MQPEIDDERLLAYAAGELTAAEAAALAPLLDAAPARAAVARYRAVRAILHADDSVAPPAAVLARAKAIFPARAAPREADHRLGLLTAARRLVADLTFDSGGGLAPALAGFRGGGTSRRLVFEANGMVVDLQVEPPLDHEQRWQIMGQVETDILDGGLVVGLAPLDDEGAAIAVTTDAHGGFHLSALAGRYNIFVRIEDAIVVLPNLVIG